MSRSRRFDRRDFWETGKVDKKQTSQIKKKDRQRIAEADRVRAENARTFKKDFDRYDPDKYSSEDD